MLSALLLGDRARAESLGGFQIPPDWPPSEDTGFFLHGLQALRDTPASQQWHLRALVLREDVRMLIGHAGFHGPPDAQGEVELTYEVLPTWRRHGFARESVQALMAWAAHEQGAKRIAASIAPDNAPSRRLVEQLGFRISATNTQSKAEERWVFDLSR
ncbi:MAG: GNAT family N-acetyltransferase [Myxococcaceae bacterium]|nr:GNAT family N-acetyltransferase [Myxococcaceae bacterium]MCI0670935.1 GNAT family N-acetyltransferase [Myxococcaceae bacterium]